MDRRSFLRSGALVTGAYVLTGCDNLCQVLGTCDDPSLVKSTASVEMSSLAQAVQIQRCEQWCWAASISMILAYHKKLITQEQIVQLTYGAVVCLPSGSSFTIGADLSRTYLDSSGRPFSSTVVAGYDPANNYRTLSNAMIVSELESNGPLLYCNRHHAMVLYSVDYTGSRSAPNIVTARVVDPWPYSERTHTLQPSEMYGVDVGGDMSFLAAVRVN